MGLLRTLTDWLLPDAAPPTAALPPRHCRLEPMESRQMLSGGDPLYVGAVYIEDDQGSDSHADTFEISFVGGAEGTQLARVEINGDQDAPGFGRGDVLFDLESTGLGEDGAQPLEIVSSAGIDDVSWHVEDGGSLLVLTFAGFDAGEKLVFEIDVDEVEYYDPQEDDLSTINDGLDPIASGIEFQGSHFTAEFSAAGFRDAAADGKFFDDYKVQTAGGRLDLSPDNVDEKPNRTAGVVLPLQQRPKPVAISGRVFHDLDLDLTQDLGEAGIADVTLALWKKEGGDYVDTGHRDVTDSLGDYLFDRHLELLPGIYQVRETQPSGYFSVGAVPGTVAGEPSGNAPAGNRDVLTEIDIPLGDSDAVDYDFAEALPATVSGHVYHDRDQDGRRDPEEEGIGGVDVRVIPIDTIARQALVTATTHADGSYSVTGLAPGRYRVVEPAQPDGYEDGLDAAGTVDGVVVGTAVNPGDNIEAVLLGSGQAGIEYNFGEVLPGSLSGYVHVDPDRDCRFDPGEDPIPRVTVQLLDDDGRIVETTKTNVAGLYHFDELPPGVYGVSIVEPPGLFHGGQVVGNGDGDAGRKDVISRITIGSDQHLLRYNFCKVPPSTISGFVFQDGPALLSFDGQTPENLHQLRDGRLTPDDARIANVVLELRDGVTGEAILGSQALPGYYGPGPIRTTTDARGFYQFEGLKWGNYAVYEIHPDGYIDSHDTPGTLSGVAFNRGSLIAVSVLRLLSVDPNNDAIVRISLPPGARSAANNFSEVRVEILPPPPVPPEPPLPPRPPVVEIPPPTPPPPVLAPQLFVPNPTDPVAGGSGVVGYTWHLSVVNSGRPRGNVPATVGSTTFWLTGAELRTAGWDAGLLSSGTWTFSRQTPEGQILRVDREHRFGLPGGVPVVGDFNGDGIDEIAIYYRGEWYIDLDGDGEWDDTDLWARLGADADQPVAGDWDGDGKDDIGIYGPAWPGDPRAVREDPGLPDPQNLRTHKAKNLPPKPEEAAQGSRVMQLTSQGRVRADLIDHVFHYGTPGDRAVSGDWNGEGIESVGIFRDGRWHLDVDADGRWSAADVAFAFGQADDLPVVGDFNGDGIDDVGVFRAGTWILDSNGNRRLDEGDRTFEFGGPGDKPVTGDFDGDGTDDPALYRDGNAPAPSQPRRS